MSVDLAPPFPWFGGKRRVASIVWAMLGDVDNYVEPFFGSGAVLLGRPRAGVATVNDKDAFVANFWRATKAAPEEVARHCDWPVNETDLLARHRWLVETGRERISRLEEDPEAYDAQVAGWWVWGLCAWLGSAWCGGSVYRSRPHLGGSCGVHRPQDLQDYLRRLSERLRQVRVCSGDWTRVVTDGALNLGTHVGVFLDPPYDPAERDPGCYSVDEAGLSARVREWCRSREGDPRLRICLAGYEGEHELPGWSVYRWKTGGTYSNARRARAKDSRGHNNRARERLWFSPTCRTRPRRKESGEAQEGFGPGCSADCIGLERVPGSAAARR